jgi:NTP pyrophosphatase (non-canonical NTP hydrolase)
MDINSYQDWTLQHDQEGTDWCLTLGLVGEAGEVAEKIKKKYRKTPLIPKSEDIAKELGDVLWYVARLAAFHGYSMTQVMAMNVDKLESRAKRGVLQGNGDNR